MRTLAKLSEWRAYVRAISCCLAFAFAFGLSAQSQSMVYIDPTYQGGNNDGSAQHPFVSWSKITSFQDNVQYLQRRGTKDTINGSISLYHNTGVQFGVYGTGTDYAYIHNLAADNGKTFNISASGHCSIDGFHLTGSYTTNCGVSVSDDWQASSFVGNNIRISNCFIEKYNWGIRSIKLGNSPFDTLVIENVKVHNIYTDGIFIQGWGTPLRGLDINKCVIDSVNQAYYPGATEAVASGDGIQLSRLVDRWIIRNTTVDRRGTANKFCIIHNDESISNTCSGTIENCTLYCPSAGTGGCNIYLSNLATMNVRYNHVYTNEVSEAMMIRGKTSVYCSYNVFSKMPTGGAKIVFDIGCGPNYFHNNTIYGGGIVFATGNYAGEMYNNIYHSTGTVYSGSAPSTRGFNLFYNATSTGTETGSIYNTDPKLADPANGNFTLLANSPCQDKAKNFGYSVDMAGTRLPQGQGYDIGAFEYYQGKPDSTVQSVVYIDPSYKGGNNDGTLNRPYASWKNISNYMDNVFYAQRRGTKDTINGGIALYHKSGIRFGVYGTGTDYANLHNIGTSSGKTFNISASSHCSVDGFHLTGTYNTNCAVSVSDDWQASSFVGNNIKITNCFIEKFDWGIRSVKLGNSPYDTLIIDNVKVHDIFTDGMFFQGFGKPLRGLDINHCYVDSVNQAYYPGATEAVASGDGIQLSQLVDGWIIHNSVIDRRGTANKFCIIHNDEGLTNTCSGTIENCTLYSPNVGTGGCNIYLSNLATVNVRKNIIYCNEVSEAMMIRGKSSVHCYFNVFSRMPSGGPKAVFDIGAGPNYFHNNTIYGAAEVFLTGSYSSEVYNNIFASAGTIYSASVLTAPDNNVYYSSTVSGTEPGSIYNVDPRFVDPANGDFHLRRGSPAIDKGRNLGYTADMAGESLPKGAGYEIGAYEYIPTDFTPPAAPSGLTSSNITYTSFDASWNPSTDNIGVTGYDVYKDDKVVAFVTGTSYSFTGLTQGTTYTVSVKARDEDGNVSQPSSVSVKTTVSSDNSAPSVPSGLTASLIGQIKFTLNWNSSTDNVAVASYDIYNNSAYYGTVSGTSAVINASPGSVNTITIKAKDAVGNTSLASSPIVVTTLPLCTGSDPWTNTSFANQTGTFSAEYDVTPNGDDLDGVTGLSDGVATAYGNMACIVRFNPAGFIDGRNGANYEAVNILPYTAGITYHVKIVGNVAAKKYDAYIRPTGSSQDIIVASQYGFRALPSQLNNLTEQTNNCHLDIANLSVNTLSDSIAPSVPSGLSYSNLGCTGVTLTWNASSDNVAVTGYDILKNGTVCTSSIGTSATISGLTPATSYTFTIRAKDGSANVSGVSSPLAVNTPADTEAPSVPSGLGFGYLTENEFTLMWSASTDNVGVTGYDVYKDGSLVTSVTGTMTTLSGLTQGTTYTITIKAKDAAGNVSAASGALIVTTSKVFDSQAPAVPTGLSFANLDCTCLKLSWNASSDNIATTGYDVYENGTLFTSVSGTTANISGLIPLTTYDFAVVAKDAAANVSGMSVVLPVTTPADTLAPLAPAGLSSSNVSPSGFTLTWNASTDNVGVTGYDVYKNGTWLASVTGTTTNVSGLTQGASCSMTVKAKDAVGNISAASTALVVLTSDTQAPGIPAGLVSSNITQTSFTLSWNASTDNIGVTGYDVYNNGALATSVSTTSASITGLNPGFTYTMTVRAKDAAGNISGVSNPLGVTTSSSFSTNLALNKDAKASTVLNNNSAFAPGKAFDGTINTRWVSAVGDANWIYVDLGTSYNISTVILKFATSYYPTAFKVQVSSDTSSWTDVYSISNGTSGGTKQIDLTPVPGRYVRMFGTMLNNHQGQYNLYELEVYGTAIDGQNNVLTTKSASVFPDSAQALRSGIDSGNASDLLPGTSVSFYPNPASDWINVQLELRSTVRILSTNGQIVYNQIAEPGSTRISLNLTPGTYILQILDIRNKVFSKILIIK